MAAPERSINSATSACFQASNKKANTFLGQRPGDLSVVSQKSGRSDGITRETVATAPMFEDVADSIFGILNGRVWAGHNIRRFDCVRIKEAFADIGRPAPVPVGIIDSLGVLTQKFGRRAGNMKMATLAAYFGLGQQKHRSLADVRMNLEVLKHCATVLFLESSLPDVLVSTSQGSPTVTTRSRSNGKLSNEGETSRKSPPTSLGNQRTVPYAKGRLGKVTERMKDVLCKAQGRQPLNNFLKYSHLVLK
ncbi:Exonuclease [Macleaya cordata]|uniref:Exonuclease n=1 Tax=Macleaya cordata TaxID=56857 RepID=A0A200QVZ3_MACCD|nr:Exonuclease [Macleaya cordata]